MLQSFIEHYGYLAILLGTFLEGETILILGGLAAHLGYLNLQGVILAAFLGTWCGDQLYFFLGRLRGQHWLESHSAWKPKASTVFGLMERHQFALILGFRFLYGLRTITPFVLGMSRVPTLRFILLNILGALLWAMCVGLLGYLFGQAFEAWIGKVKHYEAELFAAIGVGGLLVWLVHRYLNRKNNQSEH
ncbi:MAG: DedA family protein [Pseudomonadota bacterium]